MITINLQWLSVPFFVYAVYCLIGLCNGTYLIFFGEGMEQLVGLVLVQDAVLYGVGSGLIGWLIYYAFRSTAGIQS